MLHPVKFAMAGVTAAFLLASPAYAGAIKVDKALAEVEDDGTTVDVFMNISNTGASQDRLYGVKSKIARVVALTAISEEEEKELEARGLETTEALAYEIEGGQRLVLSEDGAHIELRGLNRELDEGDTFMVTLFFENAGPVRVKVTVMDD